MQREVRLSILLIVHVTGTAAETSTGTSKRAAAQRRAAAAREELVLEEYVTQALTSVNGEN